MNIWYIISFIIVGLGIVILIGCLLGSISAIKEVLNRLNGSTQRIQKQIQPIQTQVTLLNAKVSQLAVDVDRKKNDVIGVTESVKQLAQQINQFTFTSYLSTKQLVDKINSDPKIVAETEQWTNAAIHYLKRK